VDDLIKTLMQKFDLDLDKVKGILGTVAGFLGDKLPGPIGDQVAKMLDSDSEDGDGGFDLGALTDTLGGLFGGGDDDK
jgi:hypothetical protein